MFYLVHFFKQFYRSPGISSAFLFVSLLLVILAGFKSSIEHKVLSVMELNERLPYFHALISGKKNYSKVARRVSNLPGVAKIEVIPPKKLKQMVQKSLGNLVPEITSKKISSNYAGIKVVYAKNLGIRAKNLIREFIVRLGGKKNVTLGAVKSIFGSKGDPKSLRLKEIIRKWISFAILVLVTMIWAGTLWIFMLSLTKSSYLLEQFQRRKSVRIKTLLSGICLIFVIGLAFAGLLGQPIWINLAVIGMIYLGCTFLLSFLSQSVWSEQ